MQQKLASFLAQFIKVGIFACLFIPLIVTPFTLFPFVFGKVTAFIILTEALFTVFLVLVYLNRSYLPRPGIIVLLFGAWFFVLVLSTLTSINPSHSFWSTIERREGLLLFAHLALFFVMLVSVFRTRDDWVKLFQLSVLASTLVILYTLFQLIPQLFSFVSPAASLARPGGPLGNPVYMGSYLLFHIFFTLFLFFDSSDVRRRVIYGFLAGFQLAVSLFLVSARAASIGIVGGLFVAIFLFVLFRAKPRIRIAFIASVILAVLLLGFFAFFVSPRFSGKGFFFNRYFNLKENFDAPGATGKQRLLEWEAAWKGIQERPILGWGLDNFTALYDRHFPPPHPYYFASEHRVGVDRAHNIYFDWASTTGILGLFGFLSLFGGAFWVLGKRAHGISIPPPVAYIATGLLSAYLIQGIFSFDTINSYIPLFLTLGFISFLHVSSRPAPPKSTGEKTPVLGALLLGTLFLGILGTSVYFFSVKPFLAVWYARRAFIVSSEGDFLEANALFKKSSSLNTFSNSEAYLGFASSLDPRRKEEFEASFLIAEEGLKEAIKKNPHEVRYLSSLGILYNKKGVFSDPNYFLRAEELFEKARMISPTRQEILYELGANQMLQGNMKRAVEYFTIARDLDPRFPEAWWFIGIAEIAEGDIDLAKSTIERAREITRAYPVLGGFRHTKEAYWVSLVYQRIRYSPSLFSAIERLPELYPDEETFYIILGGLYAGEENYERMRDVVQKAAEVNPELRDEIEGFLNFVKQQETSK